MARELCEHWKSLHKCKECSNKQTIYNKVYWLLSEYDWNSPDQTKKQFVDKLKEMVDK